VVTGEGGGGEVGDGRRVGGNTEDLPGTGRWLMGWKVSGKMELDRNLWNFVVGGGGKNLASNALLYSASHSL
jgi:hypothetical protein